MARPTACAKSHAGRACPTCALKYVPISGKPEIGCAVAHAGRSRHAILHTLHICDAARLVQRFHGSNHMSTPVILVLRRRALVRARAVSKDGNGRESCQTPSFGTVT